MFRIWLLNSNLNNFYHISYSIPSESNLNIKLPGIEREICYLLSVSHSYAGANLYLVMKSASNNHVDIFPLRIGYSKFAVTSVNINTINIAQTGTGGICLEGLIRMN